MNEAIKLAIEQINDYSDIKTVQKLKEQIGWMNILDDRNKEIFELAKQKGLL